MGMLIMYLEKIMAEQNEKGLWQDKQGGWVHPDLIAVDKQLEDEMVESLVDEAKKVHDILIDFKVSAFDKCFSLVALLRQNYGLDRMKKSESGSVTFKNFNGTKEVQIKVTKLITFDAKLKLAKEKLDEYFTEKTEGADPEIQTLITRAFEVKNGNVDTKQILSLKSYQIKHPKWLEAMAMIDDATEIAGTKSYLGFKEREGGEIDGELKTIVLDFAAVPVRKKEGGAA
jgi:hypothetical protein